MSLATNMNKTAHRLIEKFGNRVTVTKEIYDSSADYDPTTGQIVAPTVISQTFKAAVRPVTIDELGRHELEAGEVHSVATLAIEDSLADLDNKWKINGHPIRKIVKVSVQDTGIVIKIFF